MNWHFVEMHCHTRHSDGSFTPEALVEAARDTQLDGIALTDHNTMSGWKDLEASGYPFIKGIEWTTYYGHMLVIGAKEYVEWCDAVPDNIDEKLKAVHEAGGLAGIAHPFDLGSPMCTGCYWDYNVQDWNLVDYMEVWHGEFPPVQFKARRAMRLWLEKLDAGIRLTPMYGRDWHGPSYQAEPMGVTMLGTPHAAFDGSDGFDAVREGRVMLTLGFGAYLTLTKDAIVYDIGDTVAPGSYTFDVSVDMKVRRSEWARFDIVPQTAVLLGRNARVLAEIPLTDGQAHGAVTLSDDDLFVRLELRGTAMGKPCTTALSAPLYVEVQR